MTAKAAAQKKKLVPSATPKVPAQSGDRRQGDRRVGERRLHLVPAIDPETRKRLDEVIAAAAAAVAPPTPPVPVLGSASPDEQAAIQVARAPLKRTSLIPQARNVQLVKLGLIIGAGWLLLAQPSTPRFKTAKAPMRRLRRDGGD